MVDVVEASVAVPVLERAADRARLADRRDRPSGVLGRRPVPVLEVDRDGQVGRRRQRIRMLDHLGQGCAPVEAPEGEGESGAGAGQRLEAERREDLRGPGVPGVGNQERVAVVEGPERGALLFLGRPHGHLHGSRHGGRLTKRRARTIRPGPSEVASSRRHSPVTAHHNSRRLLRFASAGGAVTASYIMPPISGIPAPAPTGSFSGGSATIASVVRMFLPIDAAFCSADRVTIVGSITPALTRSVYSPVSALRPSPGFMPRTFSTTTEPSRPEFSAI